MRWPKYFPFFIGIAVVLLVTIPALTKWDRIGIDDWDQHCFFDEVPRTSILEYNQFPFWNPYASGGRPVIGNPQYNFLRPTYIFTLLFGCIIGLRIESIILLIIGMIGMLLLARHYKMSWISGLLAATLFGLSSYFTLRIAAGHTTFFPLVFVPYAFLFYLKSLEQPRYIMLAAAFFALMILGGAVVYSFVPFAIFLGVYGTILAVQKKTLKPILLVVAIVFLSLGFIAFKSLPMIEYFASNPRITDTSREVLTFTGIFNIFLDANPAPYVERFAEQVWGWYEYSVYTGPLPLLLFILGVFLFRKKQLPLLCAAAAMFVISLGSFAQWAPWSILHSLPLLDSVRVPSRLMILFIFALAIITGLATDALLKKTNHKKILRCVLLVLLAITFVDLLAAGYVAVSTAFPNPPLTIEHHDEFAQMFDNDTRRSGAASSMYWNLKENRGTLNPFDPIPHNVSAIGMDDESYLGEVFIEGDGVASYSVWSPNRLVVDVVVKESALLVINQNDDRGWSVLDGRTKEHFNGLLATRVTPADRNITFIYRDPLFWPGVAISTVFILGAAYFINRKQFLVKVGSRFK